MLSNRYVLFAARFVVGVVFIVASIDKISAPDAFAASVHAYRLLPYVSVNIVALIVPWLELLCGVFLVTGVKLRASALLVTILLALFTIAMISALVRGLNIDCGCFGKEYASPVTWMKVFEDIGLAALGVYVFSYLRDNPPATPMGSER